MASRKIKPFLDERERFFLLYLINASECWLYRSISKIAKWVSKTAFNIGVSITTKNMNKQ